jgi:predicted nucleic acid-binding protein
LSQELRYWDSACFLAYFLEEAGRADACEAVLEEAEKGKILIVTSALTIAEVLAIRGKKQLPPIAQMKKKVIDFFKNEYIAVQNVTREVAELARDLVWDKKIKPKDAVHVASALAAGCPILETYDGPLTKKGGKVGIIIREPPPRANPQLPLRHIPHAPKTNTSEIETKQAPDAEERERPPENSRPR